MIIKGNPAGSVGFWSKHLLRDDTNEKAEVWEISGLAATDLRGALREMQGVASGSRSHGNFMYQANINPLAHEHLTPEQWKEAVDTLERNLGLEGHQRVVVEHIKEGRQHYHIIWNRVDVETMKVADMGGNYRIHEQTSRELEARFELTPTPTHSPNDRTQPEQLWEKRAAARSGIDIKAMRDELTQLWKTADTGAAFKEAIEERGYILAKGDRRDFCIVDRAGDAHSLARRLEGVKATEVRERMSDVSRDGLPSVENAREQQRSAPQRAAEAAQNVYDQIEVRRQAKLERALMQLDREMAAPKQPSDKAKREPNSRASHEARASSEPFEASTSKSSAYEALKVTDAVTGKVEKLADFVADLLSGASPRAKRDPHAEQVENIIAQRRARAALENIRASIETGKTLKGEDLQNLTPEHLNSIHAKGDSYLRELIRLMEDTRERERDRGRERER